MRCSTEPGAGWPLRLLQDATRLAVASCLLSSSAAALAASTHHDELGHQVDVVVAAGAQLGRRLLPGAEALVQLWRSAGGQAGRREVGAAAAATAAAARRQPDSWNVCELAPSALPSTVHVVHAELASSTTRPAVARQARRQAPPVPPAAVGTWFRLSEADCPP